MKLLVVAGPAANADSDSVREQLAGFGDHELTFVTDVLDEALDDQALIERIGAVASAAEGRGGLLRGDDPGWAVVNCVASHDAVAIVEVGHPNASDHRGLFRSVLVVRLARIFSKPVLLSNSAVGALLDHSDVDLVAEVLTASPIGGLRNMERPDEATAWDAPPSRIVELELELGQLAADRDAALAHLDDVERSLAAAYELVGRAEERAYRRRELEVRELKAALGAAEELAARGAAAEARAEALGENLHQLANSKVVRWSRIPRQVYSRVVRRNNARPD